MKFNFGWSILDGQLNFETGRIVIYKNFIIRSNGPSRDHNDLIKALAAKAKIKSELVYAEGHRFYWKPGKGGIFISPVRKLDEEWVYNNVNLFKGMIDVEFARESF
jgi:hypothetical protein